MTRPHGQLGTQKEKKEACAAKGQNAQVTIRHAQKAGSLGMRGMQAATWYNWAGIATAIAG